MLAPCSGIDWIGRRWGANSDRSMSASSTRGHFFMFFSHEISCTFQVAGLRGPTLPTPEHTMEHTRAHGCTMSHAHPVTAHTSLVYGSYTYTRKSSVVYEARILRPRGLNALKAYEACIIRGSYTRLVRVLKAYEA